MCGSETRPLHLNPSVSIEEPGEPRNYLSRRGGARAKYSTLLPAELVACSTALALPGNTILRFILSGSSPEIGCILSGYGVVSALVHKRFILAEMFECCIQGHMMKEGHVGLVHGSQIWGKI